jgi:hypothetical protein
LPAFCQPQVNGIEAFPVEMEVNSGCGDTTVVIAVPPNAEVKGHESVKRALAIAAPGVFGSFSIRREK